MPTRPLIPGSAVRLLAALSLLAATVAACGSVAPTPSSTPSPTSRAAVGRRGNAVRVPARVGRDARRRVPVGRVRSAAQHRGRRHDPRGHPEGPRPRHGPARGHRRAPGRGRAGRLPEDPQPPVHRHVPHRRSTARRRSTRSTSRPATARSPRARSRSTRPTRCSSRSTPREVRPAGKLVPDFAACECRRCGLDDVGVPEPIAELERASGNDPPRAEGERRLAAEREPDRETPGRGSQLGRPSARPIAAANSPWRQGSGAATLTAPETAIVGDREAVEADDVVDVDPAEPLSPAAERAAQPEPEREGDEAHQRRAGSEHEARPKERDADAQRLGAERGPFPLVAHGPEEGRGSVPVDGLPRGGGAIASVAGWASRSVYQSVPAARRGPSADRAGAQGRDRRGRGHLRGSHPARDDGSRLRPGVHGRGPTGTPHRFTTTSTPARTREPPSGSRPPSQRGSRSRPGAASGRGRGRAVRTSTSWPSASRKRPALFR